MKESLIEQLKTQQIFFLNTVSCLSEEDSSFKPTDEMYTVAQQIGHTAETYSWFIDGAFSDKGFDMDQNGFIERTKSYKSFNKCVQQFKDSVENAIKKIESLPEKDFFTPITGEIMKGAPKMSVIGALSDHTAHHRGALSVYARLLGKTPKMPYV